MKLNDENNKKLLAKCALIEAMKYEITATGEKNNPDTQRLEEFKDLYKYLKYNIENDKPIVYSTLKRHFDDSIIVKGFLSTLESSSKRYIVKEYYRKAQDASKLLTGDKAKEVDKKLTDFFLKAEHNMKIKLNRENCKFVAKGLTVTALATVLATHALHGGKSTDTQTSPVPIETELPTATPQATQNPVLSSIDNIRTNDEDFYQNLVNNFKTIYAEEYNTENGTNYTADDLEFRFYSQNYTFKATINGEERYAEKLPANNEYRDSMGKFLANNNISYTCIDGSDLKKFTISEKSSGTVLDKAMYADCKVLKLYNYDERENLIDPNYDNYSLLAQFDTALYALTIPDTEQNRPATLRKYMKGIKKYLKSKERTTLNNDSIEHQIDEQLYPEEYKTSDDYERD